MKQRFPWVFVAVFFVTSCVKEDLRWNLEELPSLPTVRTDEVNSPGATQANASGKVTDDGNLTVTERGFCVSTSPTPDLEDEVYNAGNGTGSFTAMLVNLSAETTYFVRAFATNELGTAFGEQVSFTTDSPPPSMVGENNCSSLSGATTQYGGMNGTTGVWGISSSGYSGSCWQAPNPNSGGQLGTAIGTHYVQFNHTFENDGFIEFWLNTYNPGYDNLVPNVTVDGVGQPSPVVIDGDDSSFSWMKVRTADISAGTHTIRITFTGSYYVFKLDELDFYEYQ